MPPRTKPKRYSLVTVPLVTALAAAAVMYAFNRSTVRPPGTHINVVRGVLVIIAFGTLSTGVLWLLNRHLARTFKFPPGTCRQCAYDRTGLAANTPCPECGSTASPVT